MLEHSEEMIVEIKELKDEEKRLLNFIKENNDECIQLKEEIQAENTLQMEIMQTALLRRVAKKRRETGLISKKTVV